MSRRTGNLGWRAFESECNRWVKYAERTRKRSDLVRSPDGSPDVDGAPLVIDARSPLARADRVGALLEIGRPTQLETGNPLNVAYYEKFGFRVLDESEAPDEGPRVWIMRRSDPDRLNWPDDMYE